MRPDLISVVLFVALGAISFMVYRNETNLLAKIGLGLMLFGLVVPLVLLRMPMPAFLENFLQGFPQIGIMIFGATIYVANTRKP